MTSSEIVIEPVLTFGAYLKEQAALQQRLPVASRRAVPTYKELGEQAKVDYMTIYRQTSHSQLSQLPLDLAYRIMLVMHDLGFKMGVRDLVTWDIPAGLQRPPQGWEQAVEVTAPDRLAVTLGTCLEACRRVGDPRIPTITDLAMSAQWSRRQLTRILSDKVQRLDLRKLGDLLTVLARVGWGITPEDVLYYPITSTTLLLPGDTPENDV